MPTITCSCTLFTTTKQGLGLSLRQFKAMFIKRFVYSSRNRMAIITQLALPLFFTLLALSVALNEQAVSDDPPRRLVIGYVHLRVFFCDCVM